VNSVQIEFTNGANFLETITSHFEMEKNRLNSSVDTTAIREIPKVEEPE
jgi:hypothetical protein